MKRSIEERLKQLAEADRQRVALYLQKKPDCPPESELISWAQKSKDGEVLDETVKSHLAKCPSCRIGWRVFVKIL